LLKTVKRLFRDERGSMAEMAWTLGSAVVVVLIIVAFMTLAPATAKTFWISATNYIQSQFGF